MKQSTLSSMARRRLAADLARRRDDFAQRMSGSAAAARSTHRATASVPAPGARPRRGTRAAASITQLELELRRVDAALQRIDSGTFGTCCRCGLDIEARWLEKDPATAFCAACCEELAEQQRHRRSVS